MKNAYTEEELSFGEGVILIVWHVASKLQVLKSSMSYKDSDDRATILEGRASSQTTIVTD